MQVFERYVSRHEETLRVSTLFFAQGFNVSRRRRAFKRVWDLTFSALGLVLAAPLIGLTALAVWATSGRPVFFRQERVGQYNAVFTLYKFRSMRLDAEAGGPVWARANDDRVTTVGRFIRLPGSTSCLNSGMCSWAT